MAFGYRMQKARKSLFSSATKAICVAPFEALVNEAKLYTTPKASYNQYRDIEGHGTPYTDNKVDNWSPNNTQRDVSGSV